MNVQRLTLDLDKSSVPRGRVTIAQCDHDGTTVEAEIYDNGVALDTSGLSAYLVMRLPDGRHYYRVSATLDGHVATALVDEAYAAVVVGTTEIAYFELVGSGATYSTSRFGVRVLPSATADATVPETWDGEVERLIQQLDEMAESSRVIIDDLTTLEEIVGASEQGRVAAESDRVSAETARANAETARASAEQDRVTAEQSRVTAEQGRVTAESARVTKFATLKAESQAATSAATTAAGNADAATTRANTAAQNADTKARLAETATSFTNEATAQANAAADDATLAAAQARGAISANLRFSIDVIEIDGARRLVFVDAGESE